MRTRLLSRSPVAIIGVVLAVTGFFSASPRPPAATKIVADMKPAFARAISFRIAGDLDQAGQPDPIDLEMTRSDDVSGLYSADGVTTKVIITRGRTYILLSPAFYRYLVRRGNVMSAPCASICGRYILRNMATSPFQGLFSAYLRFFPEMFDVRATTPVTAVIYQGQAAYEFSDTNGDRIYISRSDYPYPIAVFSQAGSSGGPALTGTTLFSQWNKVPPITAPPASKVITERNLFASGSRGDVTL